jgi:hypothetical protein
MTATEILVAEHRLIKKVLDWSGRRSAPGSMKNIIAWPKNYNRAS